MNERLEERERAWREGWLGELPMHDGHPACSRHGDAVDDASVRVRMALLYAMGLAGGSAAAAAMAATIGRAHDHKGMLSVVLRGPLPGRCRRALRRAWAEVAGEDADCVMFHAAGDPGWRAVWAGRRFDTDWRP